MRILELVFPKLCVGCGRLGQYYCRQCTWQIKQSELVCPSCERPAAFGAAHPLCKRRYGLDGLWSLGIYQGSLGKAIQKLKYRWVREIAQALVDLTVEYWARFNPQFLQGVRKDRGVGWVVVPVPLHWQRQNWRGFNQAALLGELLSQKLGLGYREGLRRVRFTTPQVELKGPDRYKNIRNAFVLSPGFPISRCPNILLIDDVWTTGATLKECCYVLKRAGAKKVWAITLAR